MVQTIPNKMSYYDYDAICHLNEQRAYQRYYNTPLEVDGVWFACLADYQDFHHLKMARLQKMTVDLKTFIRQMVVEKMCSSLEQFPPLTK
jgi:hypothetical protein